MVHMQNFKTTINRWRCKKAKRTHTRYTDRIKMIKNMKFHLMETLNGFELTFSKDSQPHEILSKHASSIGL